MNKFLSLIKAKSDLKLAELAISVAEEAIINEYSRWNVGEDVDGKRQSSGVSCRMRILSISLSCGVSEWNDGWQFLLSYDGHALTKNNEPCNIAAYVLERVFVAADGSVTREIVK